MKMKYLGSTIILAVLFTSCSSKDVPKKTDNRTTTPTVPTTPASNFGNITQWITLTDKSLLLSKSSNSLIFNDANTLTSAIEVDTTIKYQQMDGFGFCLTDASAMLLRQMSETNRNTLLTELFANNDNNIGISYIRISIGASDLSTSVYTYDDLPSGQTDSSLTKFKVDGTVTATDLIPVLKQILAINPKIKILGSPWTAPSWMKTNNASKGGSLLPKYFASYANYLVKFIRAMTTESITIDAITPQNEPLNPDNNPSMYMTAADQATFIQNYLGPIFVSNNITAKIIVYDHNADKPDYPMAILNNPQAAQFVDGSAFHLYSGDISALSTVRNAYPNKNIYFTEQYTSSTGSFGGDLTWAIKNLIVGASQNWSKNVLEWNLASDPSLSMHTSGGCTICLGAVTIGGNTVTRNQSYYIIAHASKFVDAGSYRIASSSVSNVSSVAFLTPSGKKVLIAVNTSNAPQTFNIKYKGHTALTSLNVGMVTTYVW